MWTEKKNVVANPVRSEISAKRFNTVEESADVNHNRHSSENSTTRGRGKQKILNKDVAKVSEKNVSKASPGIPSRMRAGELRLKRVT